ncbi:MAG: class I SAM-dependent methyltransferase [Pseudomonadota bacterium]
MLDTLRWAEQVFGLADRRVIEVGGTAPREVVAPWRPRSWVGCDPLAADGGDEAWGTRRATAEALPFADATADLVFSTCAFEHLHDLDGALAEITRVLRPGGALLTQFAPIWTCSVGHHLRLPGTERGTLRFRDPIVPAWGHLLLDERELAFFLCFGLPSASAARAAAWIFHDPYLSRRPEADYRRAFAACGLQRRVLTSWGERVRLPRGLRAALEEAHPAAGRFDLPGFRVLLAKPGG